MAVYAYLFEARGIQRFLFATGKLKDMIQGSELIDYICAENGYVDQVLITLNLQKNVKAPRKAGGVFYLIFEQKEYAQRFQAAWRLAASQWFPGVEGVDALTEADSIKAAIAKGIKQLSEARNQLKIELPNASPITERSPRTGLAAVKQQHTASGKKESVDVATATVRNFKRPQESITLADRFLPSQDIKWPNNFEQDADDDKKFPLGKRGLVGLIHADGNGLGEILRLLNKACENATDDVYVDLYQTFSDAVTKATIQATQQASEKILLPHTDYGVMPARPLVAGGDDVSVIIRADLAIPFTQAFLIAFKQTSKDELAKLKAKFKQYHLDKNAEELPDSLTACAGIVFMKASQPFHSAYSLAEGLCKQAKNYSRQYKRKNADQKVEIIPSSLAFYKVSDSLLEDIDAMYTQTQIAIHADQQYHLCLPAYLVDENNLELANIEQLLDIHQLLETSSLNDRPLREIATLIHANVDHAKQAYKRWNYFSERNIAQLSKLEQKQLSELEHFKHVLAQIVGHLMVDLPFHQVNEQQYQSILGDLLALATISEEVQQKQKVESIAS
ncbi:hypothetical protein RFI02_12025 [Acinetobacter sichuanensis]|uniref:Cas10/Cmr2 second palm domain-containing protein n=1 Tax=Acinetobacter sichuanensis TaxID=2136183 RepID=UPI00280FD732|nr:hypothetical protein [Acinetobacter sichuanensis]MDQ9021833.1 hypothetical protein [Acinetobacter sichuanensis]